MAGNQKKMQHTMLIQKGVDKPTFMKTANGGKKMAGGVVSFGPIGEGMARGNTSMDRNQTYLK